MTAAITAAEAAQQKATEAVEELTDARMALRRVQVRIDNLDPETTADDLDAASKRVAFAERVVVGAQKAADAAASGQVADDARAAVAALLAEYGGRDAHIADVKPLVATAAQALAAAVELVRSRNDAILRTTGTVNRAKRAIPEGTLPDIEAQEGYGAQALINPPMHPLNVEDVLAAALVGAIGWGGASDSGHGPNKTGKIGTAARNVHDAERNPFRVGD